MKQRSSFVLIFLFFIVGTLLIGAIVVNPFFLPIRGAFEAILLPFERMTYSFTHQEDTSELSKIKMENVSLKAALTRQKEEEREMQALKDQFAVESIPSQSLLPATIIGRRDDDTFVLDQGSNDAVKNGMRVFVKDSYVGTINYVTPHMAILDTVSKTTTSITAKTVNTNANGIIRGVKSGHMIMDHVILSDSLTVGDTVVTKGETDVDKGPFPPGSIIGKIISIDKKSSDLFQSAKVESFIDLSHISTVFILLK